ncbi:replication factor C subunit 3-like [Pteropus vampyrus]|uniref:Replication factor C subunit 3-like n=1 Tax=Pteropus vampyrus TaxID=132908 RepID=A0A6P6CIT9_PTEVA|nr:replication factor C subunit 3-like [Pteropus vampyrus]
MAYQTPASTPLERVNAVVYFNTDFESIPSRIEAQVPRVVQCGDFPHLLVYGPSGAGKKTRIMCILRELYGVGVEKLRIEHQTITVSISL